MTGQAEALGEKIRAVRKQLKMTQAELAGPDFTKSFISQVEKGFARPSLKSLQILASRLNKPVSFFLEGEETPEPAPPVAKTERLLQSGRALSKQGHFQDALDIYEDVLNSIPKSEHALRSQTLIDMSAALWHLDRQFEAIDALEEGLDLHRHFHDPSTRVESLERLAKYTEKLGDVSRAAALCEQALAVLQDHGLDQPMRRVKLHTEAGLYFTRLWQLPRAERHLRMAMELAQASDDYYKWGEICHAMGFVLGEKGDLPGAIQFSTRAVHFYEAVNHPKRKIGARINTAAFMHRAGQGDKAAAELQRALSEAEAANDPVAIAHVYQVQGELAEKDEDWERAVAAFHQALERQRRSDTQGLLHQALARCLHRLQRPEDALEHGRRAVALLEKGNEASKEELAQAYYELALLLKDTGALDEAQDIFNRSLALYGRTESQRRSVPEKTRDTKTGAPQASDVTPVT